MIVGLDIVFGLAAVLQLILAYRVQYVDKDGRTNKHKIARRIQLVANIIVAFGLATMTVYSHKKSEMANRGINSKLNGISTNASDIDSNVNEVKSDVASVRSALATNSSLSPVAREALIDSANKDAIKHNEEIKIELAGMINTDLRVLRKERQANEAVAEINRQRNQLKTDEVNQQSQELKANEQQIKLRDERRRNTDSAVIFNYAITRFDQMLSDIGKQTGNNVAHNFSTAAPTIYSPGIMDDTGFHSTTNFVALGTNAEWQFTTIVEWNPPMLRIRGHEINTLVNIYPDETAIDTNGAVSQLHVITSIDNGQMIRDEKCLRENCNPTVDFALRSLIEAQDELFRLKLVTESAAIRN